jgi:hypothetical protein
MTRIRAKSTKRQQNEPRKMSEDLGPLHATELCNRNLWSQMFIWPSFSVLEGRTTKTAMNVTGALMEEEEVTRVGGQTVKKFEGGRRGVNQTKRSDQMKANRRRFFSRDIDIPLQKCDQVLFELEKKRSDRNTTNKRNKTKETEIETNLQCYRV